MDPKKSKKLFQAILGELLSLEYEGEDEQEMVRIAMGAVSSFCTQFKVDLDYKLNIK